MLKLETRLSIKYWSDVSVCYCTSIKLLPFCTVVFPAPVVTLPCMCEASAAVTRAARHRTSAEGHVGPAEAGSNKRVQFKLTELSLWNLKCGTWGWRMNFVYANGPLKMFGQFCQTCRTLHYELYSSILLFIFVIIYPFLFLIVHFNVFNVLSTELFLISGWTSPSQILKLSAMVRVRLNPQDTDNEKWSQTQLEDKDLKTISVSQHFPSCITVLSAHCLLQTHLS